jgi:hypothetical protein
MVPSTLLDVAQPRGAAPPPPGELAQLFLASALGLVAGPILAAFQWRVLRHHVEHGGWWLPANALAWALGMPILFTVAGSVPADGGAVVFAVRALGTAAVAGAVVGAIHGAVLVRLIVRRGTRVA